MAPFYATLLRRPKWKPLGVIPTELYMLLIESGVQSPHSTKAARLKSALPVLLRGQQSKTRLAAR